MINFRIFVVCAFLLVYGTTYAAPQDAVVQLIISVGNNAGRSGSGFYYTPSGDIVTAYHVIVGAKTIRMIDSKKNAIDDLVVTHIAPMVDLALLKAKSSHKSYKYIKTSNKKPRLSDELRTIGSPWGILFQTFSGRRTSENLVSTDQVNDVRGRPLFSN
jgi:S1-C subfamily serine protease